MMAGESVAGSLSIQRPVEDMRGHHRRDACGSGTAKGRKLDGLQSLSRCLDHRQFFVRIGVRIAMTWKMFAAGHDPVFLEPCRRRQPHFTDHSPATSRTPGRR